MGTKLTAFLLLLSIVLCLTAHSQNKLVTVKATSDSEARGYEADLALDGDPETMWHSIWKRGKRELPHDLKVDLGKNYEISGFVYVPREGCGNGTVRRYEFYVGDDREKLGSPVAAGSFTGRQKAYTVRLHGGKTNGRYVCLRALSEINGHRIYASVAELNILSPGFEFRTDSVPDTGAVQLDNPGSEADRQYNVLLNDLTRRSHFNQYSNQVFHPASLIADSDRDPLDVILRRTETLLADIKKMPEAPETRHLEDKLIALREKAFGSDPGKTQERLELFRAVHALRRKIAFSNPLVGFDKLLFIERERALFSHMCDQYYGRNAVPGGSLFVLSDPFGKSPLAEDLLSETSVERGKLSGSILNKGGFLSPELSYDAKTILFAYVACEGDRGHIAHTDHSERGHWTEGQCYHIFKVNTDGTGLEQLTEGTWNDFDPCFLPNGRIAFISERRGGYLRCGRACPSYTVFDMMTDGSDIRILSPHENNEWHPSVTHDGMIIYTRWDYVDRHGRVAHHPWIMTPDGRDSRALHGNFSVKRYRADMEMDLRAIPGSHRIIGTAAPHHGQAYGSIIIIDPRIPDDDAMAPVKRFTPDVGFPESQDGKQVYGTPWPLNEKYCICVYDAAMRSGRARQGSKHRKGNYGIYLVDAFGNKVLIYRDPKTACLSPIPLRPRKKPPVVPERCERLAKNPPAYGTMAVVNVYDSLKPWPENTTIKALRIYQTHPMSVPSGNPPHETGRRIAEARDSVNLARRIIGTVPVEEDGSAYFRAPALKELYFQALDEEGLAVQSMRSVTWVQPGEKLLCQGCHEPKNRTPIQPTGEARAFRRPPSIPEPDVDGTDPFSYPRLVQPVLDRKCVDCHSKNQNRNAPLLGRKIVQSKLGRRKTNVFQSYDSLIHKYAFWKYGDHYRTIPGKFGARASKLYHILGEGHHEVKLSREEMHRITIWLDSSSNFYGVYEKDRGEAQLRGEIARPTLLTP